MKTPSKRRATRRRARSSAPSSRRVRPAAATSVGRQTIAEAAYFLWERQGCPQGLDVDHWLAAERQLSRTA